MAKTTDTTDYRHVKEKRKNIPLSKIASEGRVPKAKKVKYSYSPHLSPKLRFDPDGDPDKLPELLEEAQRRRLTAEEASKLAEALWHQQPWLEWAGKQEEHARGGFEVDPVALHIHERVSARAIIEAARREDIQKSLFADPQQPYHEAVQFYRHDVDWTNRLILGDSLQVMSSLATREGLAGKVQMIYMDPPYGIKFASNFQVEVGKRNVRDTDRDMSRELETVKAYRDTWQLGIHSYLGYLRNRFTLAKDLLSVSGSIFVQINDENIHFVRDLLDEVFGPEQFCSLIAFRKTSAVSSPQAKVNVLACTTDYLLWYARSRDEIKYHQLYLEKSRGGRGGSQYNWAELQSGFRNRLKKGERPASRSRLFGSDNLQSPGFSERLSQDFEFQGNSFSCGPNRHWKTTNSGLQRLAGCDRLLRAGKSVYYVRYLDDFPVYPLTNEWPDTASSFMGGKRFVVQTNTRVVERCILMTTDSGELVLDPTCGSGTTAYVAEKWGRRWITIDTSRVAVSLARQRLLTSKFEHFKVENGANGSGVDPSRGFVYKKVPHITLGSIAQNENLDPIFDKHEPILDRCLEECNHALGSVDPSLREQLESKLREKRKTKGKRAITEADERRWKLPEEKFEHWTVPFDTDPDWPQELQDAVTAYRKAWREKMDEVNQCIADNADYEVLVDQPEVVPGVVRVSGPFTVEGVLPAELSLDEEGLFAGAPEELESSTVGQIQGEGQNRLAYLKLMTDHIQRDGLTFLNNQHHKFQSVEPRFDAGSSTVIHAEGTWEETDDERATVGIGFGPQYGPVTALQVEELIRAANRRGYDELVVAGFSFDPEATAVIQEVDHRHLQIHMAQIRPDINPSMQGLLKDTPNSQLFTVFGLPAVSLEKNGNGEYICTLEGVDIYDPVKNVVRSSGATKVAAWFLDSDYDGRCFCITQAFFPNQDAWKKLAKALKTVTDPEAFEAFSGTQSLPFKPGKHRKAAVKVIDPRGNEVMTTVALEN